MFYRPRYNKNYQPKTIKENPELGPRLEKIKKENLDQSTIEFIDSLLDFFKKKGGLTDNQVTAFQKIESRFSPHEKVKLELWKKEYLEHYLKKAKIIAEYYSRTGYFTILATKILQDEKFVPSKQELKKMMMNTYAAKVLEANKAEPKFAINAKVQVRSTVGTATMDKHLRPLRSRLAFVLANNLPIVNATAGAKRYKVLPMGASEPVDLDEKHLMKPNKKGKYS